MLPNRRLEDVRTDVVAAVVEVLAAAVGEVAAAVGEVAVAVVAEVPGAAVVVVAHGARAEPVPGDARVGGPADGPAEVRARR